MMYLMCGRCSSGVSAVHVWCAGGGVSVHVVHLCMLVCVWFEGVACWCICVVCVVCGGACLVRCVSVSGVLVACGA